MPVEKSPSLLISQFGDRARKAAAAHRDDEVDYGFQRLPPGINNGIAQLVKCYIAKVDKDGDFKGKLFFRAEGRVLSPKFHNGEKVEGRITSIMEMLCDTERGSRRSFEEHLAWVQNELKKFKVEPEGLDADNLEATMAALAEVKPCFRFRTSQGKPTAEYPEPRVFENWDGFCDPPTGTEDNSQDHSGPATSPASRNGAPGARSTPAKPTPAPVAEFNEFDDLDTLLMGAKAGDEEPLQARALAAGLTEADIEAADSWDEVVLLIRNLVEAATEDWLPQVGDIYGFKAQGNKSKRLTEVKIVAVNRKKRTVTLQAVANADKVWQDVSWDKLEGLASS